MTIQKLRATGACRQKGSSAVEFAFIFPVLFIVLYATVAYAYVFVLKQSITYAAQHAAEAGVSADPLASNRATLIATQVRAVAVQTLAWLPAAQQTRVLGDASGSAVAVSFPTIGATQLVQVNLVFDLQGLFPAITMPLLGSLPPMPPTITTQAVARI